MEIRNEKTIGNIMSNAVAAIKFNFSELIKLVGLTILIGCFYVLLSEGATLMPVVSMLLLVISIVPYMMVSMALVAGETKLIYEGYLGNKISWKEAFKFGWSKKWSVLGASLLAGFIVMIPVGIIVGIGTSIIMVGGNITVAVIFGAINGLLVAIFMGVFFAFMNIGIVCKDLNAVDSIKYTLGLYKNQIGELLPKVIIITLLVSAISIIFSIPTLIIENIVSNESLYAFYYTPSIKMIILAIIFGIISQIVTVLTSLYSESALLDIAMEYDKELKAQYNKSHNGEVILKEEEIDTTDNY